MKIYLIKKYFDTKRKADRALSELGIAPPKSGGIEARHGLLMQLPVSKLKSLAYV